MIVCHISFSMLCNHCEKSIYLIRCFIVLNKTGYIKLLCTLALSTMYYWSDRQINTLENENDNKCFAFWIVEKLQKMYISILIEYIVLGYRSKKFVFNYKDNNLINVHWKIFFPLLWMHFYFQLTDLNHTKSQKCTWYV